MKIPLFDIDGTLIKAGSNINREAFKFAVKKTYDIDANQTDINPEGMIDNEIFVDVLKLHGLSEKEIKEKIKQATEVVTEYAKTHKGEIILEVLPGVIELLKILKEQKIPVGVLTGNVEGLAWIKLEKAQLRNFIDFGAFGDKVYKRVELVEHARINAQRALHEEFEINDFIIVGDTPKDIRCAKDAGIASIAISTGNYPFEELVDEKPDLALHSLEDKERVIQFLKS